MMSDPNYPIDLNRILSEFNRRIKNLESRSTMQNTHITAFIQDGTPSPEIEAIAKFGVMDDGSIGVEIGSQLGSPSLRVDNVNGMITPEIPIPIQRGTPVSLNDDLENNAWVSYAQLASHTGVEYRSRITTSSGVTVECWLETSWGAETAHVIIPGSTSQQMSFAWLHGSPIGLENQFIWKTIRTAGTLNYLVYEPNKFSYVGPEGCTITGV